MKPTQKAMRDALKFMADAVNNAEMPPETRRKCAEMILERACAPDDGNAAATAAVTVTYKVVE